MSVVEDPRLSDSVDSVPFAVVDPLRIPKERYFDRQFFELEKRHLWSKVWQMACRIEEIPEPGDFTEYEICDQSIILVRQPDLSVKGFYNACRHRSTELCKGSGSLSGKQIVCPFHGWRWNLDGSSSFVYGREGFSPQCLQADDIRLQECKVEVFGACVWVNLDPNARPFLDAMEPVAQLLEESRFQDMRVTYWQETVFRANWKLGNEAFHEGYHVMASHPQLTMGLGESYSPDNIDYEPLRNGHAIWSGRFNPLVTPAKARSADDYLERFRILVDNYPPAVATERDFAVLEGIRNKVPPGEDFGAHAVRAIYEHAEGAGIPMPPMGNNLRLWGGSIFIFPNIFIVPNLGNARVLRFRPHEDDPECCRLDNWSLAFFPVGSEPGRPLMLGCFAPDDPENWALTIRQDFNNIERQARGLHSQSADGMRLSGSYERAISNMHGELDRYLANHYA